VGVSSELQAVIRFGLFEADLRAGELRKNGVRIKIQDLPFRGLTLLLSHPNEVVTREDFRQSLWGPDVFVDFDRGISSAIKRLRDALGDSAENPIFVETIDRRGYRWIAPITPAPIMPAPITTTTASATSAPVPENQSGPEFVADALAATEGESSKGFPRSRVMKLVYVAAALALLFVAWSLRPGNRLAESGKVPHLSGNAIGADGSTKPPLRPTNHPANPKAKNLYLQGRYYWNKRTPEDLNKAVDYFTQAIVHDPGYADAYVGLADSYALLREYTAMPSSEAFPRALAAATKAVELDAQSSPAHASFAFALFWGAWDAPTADREFRRSIELDPNNATAHHWYASALGAMDRFPEALAEIERARALDPTSKSIVADQGDLLDLSGRRPEALSLLRQMETAEPEFISPHRYLKVLYLEMGDYSNYLLELKKDAALSNNRVAQMVADAAEKGFAAGGAHGMFERIRREQQTLYDQGKFSPYSLAQTCALEGNKRAALKYLKAAYDRHDEGVIESKIDPLFASLRDEPEFRRIVTDLGFPNPQLAQIKPAQVTPAQVTPAH
jgi:DNA-binding winged helix-turn-helix (wHTH) protein/tetratricopeptide (TPR) repeat protein